MISNESAGLSETDKRPTQGLLLRGFVLRSAVALLSVLGSAQVSAQSLISGPLVPPPPANVVAAKAHAALERNCAGCHQAGRLEGRTTADAGIANILALDEVGRDASLVRPGVPDASRIYNIALTRELHLDALNDPAEPPPSASELQSLRDWISELPDSRGQCSGREPQSASRIAALVERLVSAMTPERARQTRFLSIAHLYNACASDAELAAFREAIPRLVQSIAPRGAAEPVEGWAQPVDDQRLVFAVRLSAFGWRPEGWSELIPSYPLQAFAAASLPSAVGSATGSGVPLVHADWFADAVLSLLPVAVPSGGPQLWGRPLPEALAHAWRRPASLSRVKADLGLAETAALTELPAWEGLRRLPAAINLRAGGVARREELSVMLPALMKSIDVPKAATAERLEIALASDKTAYRVGDTASFQVVASRNCFLTLIAVDRGGRATVLFPNELAPDNRVSAGSVTEVPGPSASYRFRFKEKGRETIVAVCSQNRRAPEGITHDFDRLRFTVLGDWQLFLREPPELTEARRDDAATDVPRPLQRQRRRGRPADAPVLPAASPMDVQTRTAITLDIE